MLLNPTSEGSPPALSRRREAGSSPSHQRAGERGPLAPGGEAEDAVKAATLPIK